MKAIYKIENTKTKDLYVGSAVNFAYRKWTHLKRLRENKHHSPILQNSWNKHGESSFKFEILEEVEDKKKLIEREQYYIDTLSPRYNICKKAGSPLGVKHTYEARMNMSLAHKGKKLSQESIEKRTATVLGSKRNQDTIDKMKKSALKKEITQFSLLETTIRDWMSAKEAGDALSISPSHITACCKGRRKKAGNYIWKYKN